MYQHPEGESSGKITPAMQQFYTAKEQYPDCIIFFRMGDFYETFCEDAEVCARELEITLTSRGKMPDGTAIPLAGIPYHALDGYLSRMIGKGYRVAICEQVEDPKLAKGIVKREVIRVVTPGTVIDAPLLSSEGARYLMALYLSPATKGKKQQRGAGIAFIEISTGDFQTEEVTISDEPDAIRSVMARYKPAECLIPTGTDKKILDYISHFVSLITPVSPDLFFIDNAKELLKTQFSGDDTALHGLSDNVICAAGAALAYARNTQFSPLCHIRGFSNRSSGLILDAVTLRNLEVIENIRNRSEDGTLVKTLDLTKTPIGRRLIRQRITSPIADVRSINERLDCVSFFIDMSTLRLDVISALNRYPDLERIAGRISYGNAGPRDLVSLGRAIDISLTLKEMINAAGKLPSLLYHATESLTTLRETSEKIKRAIVDEPPVLLKKGDVIREGYSEELDRIRLISRDGRQWIADLEQKEKERTGIKSLKIRYNAVFGYYIEVTKTNLKLVPKEYERRQTTANAERFTIPALKEVESQIATADERLFVLEESLYNELMVELQAFVTNFQETARAIGEIDLYSCLAEVALKNGYTRPVLSYEPDLLIRDGRHPVVEKTLSAGFVPNDAELSAGNNQILIITGANMAGKSTYMRSVALIVIMAQMGSYVPAAHAGVGIVDRIFTRVGAFDDLASGQSTFMVEMSELSTILNHATEKSLVILDEIGRGTSTLDGYCIAKACLENLHGKKNKGPRTLFATHFHEIVGIEEELKRVVNCHFAVRESDDDVVFLRKLVPGATDRSYGIHVAKLAGVPASVVNRAETLMKRILNGDEVPSAGNRRYTQMMLFDGSTGDITDPLISEIASIDLDQMTPLQALTTLAGFKERAEEKSKR